MNAAQTTAPTQFDYDAAQGVLTHHAKDLNEQDTEILNTVIDKFENKQPLDDEALRQAREIFATFRADGRP